MKTQIITVNSKGQIVIPKKIRNELGIEYRDKLLIYTNNDSILLKVLKLPNSGDFKKNMDEAEAWAKSVGYQESDINPIIKEVRKSRK